MEFRQTERICKDVLVKGNNVLNNSHSEDGEYLICTTKFQNGFEVDIKVNKGKEPWVEGVLFDQNGEQVGDPEYGEEEVLGEYYFNDGENEYFVTVETKE